MTDYERAARQAHQELCCGMVDEARRTLEAAFRPGAHEHVYRCQDCGEIGDLSDEAYIRGFGEGHEEGFRTAAKAAMDAVGRLVVPRDPGAYTGGEAKDAGRGG